LLSSLLHCCGRCCFDPEEQKKEEQKNLWLPEEADEEVPLTHDTRDLSPPSHVEANPGAFPLPPLFANPPKTTLSYVPSAPSMLMAMPATTMPATYEYTMPATTSTPSYGLPAINMVEYNMAPATTVTPSYGLPATNIAPTYGLPGTSIAPSYGLPATNIAPTYGLPGTSIAPTYGVTGTTGGYVTQYMQ
jgi:hypothetical protein